MDTSEIIFLIIPAVPLCIVTSIILILLFKDAHLKKGLYGTKTDVINEIFYGGWKWMRNVICLGATVSNIFCPCLLVESLYITNLQAINLMIARTLAFWLCVFIWYRISNMGFQSIPCYLFERFQSTLLLNVYHLNSFMGIFYIYFVYNGPLLFSALEQLKTSTYYQFICCTYIVLCGVGGMRAVIVVCTFLLPLELIGSIMLSANSLTYNLPADSGNIYTTCFSANPLVSFASSICLLMSVQPAYLLFYSASSRKTALISMAIGNLIFLIRSALALTTASSIKSFGRSYDILHYRWLWASIKYPQGVTSDVSAVISDPMFNQTSLKVYYMHVWDFGLKGLFILTACVFTPLTTFYCLRLVSLTCDIIEKITTYLIAIKIVNKGYELQQIFTSMHCVLSAWFAMGLLSCQSNIRMPSSRNFDLYIPQMTNLLMPGVTVILTLGSLVPQAHLLPMVCGWIVALVLGTCGMATVIFRKQQLVGVIDSIISWSTGRHDDFWWLCLNSWSMLIYLGITLFFILLSSSLFGEIKQWFLIRNLKLNAVFVRQPKNSIYTTIHASSISYREE